MLVVSSGGFWRRFFYSLTCIALSVVISVGFVHTCSQAKEAPAVPQILNDSTFNTWRDFIHPDKNERVWERIQWYTTLWTGLTLAQQQKKPLMFMSMTGHPCGLT